MCQECNGTVDDGMRRRVMLCNHCAVAGVVSSQVRLPEESYNMMRFNHNFTSDDEVWGAVVGNGTRGGKV